MFEHVDKFMKSRRMIISTGGHILIDSDVYTDSVFLDRLVKVYECFAPDVLEDADSIEIIMISKDKDYRHRTVPKNRKCDEHGQPICPKCKETTNRAYAHHPILVCWKCGADM